MTISKFSKFYVGPMLIFLLVTVPTDVITDVIGICSVFFKSFVCL